MTRLISIVLVWLPFLCWSQGQKFTWDVHPDTNAVGYKILTGQASGLYTATNQVNGRFNNTALVTNGSGGRLFSALVALDAGGLQSDPSNEVIWTNRIHAPTGFKLSASIQTSKSVTGPWTNLAYVDVVLPPLPDSTFFRSNLILEQK